MKKWNTNEQTLTRSAADVFARHDDRSPRRWQVLVIAAKTTLTTPTAVRRHIVLSVVRRPRLADRLQSINQSINQSISQPIKTEHGDVYVIVQFIISLCFKNRTLLRFLITLTMLVSPKTVHFKKFGNKNAPQGRIPHAILTNFSGFVGGSTADLRFKFGGIRVRDWVVPIPKVLEFTLGDAFFLKFSASSRGKTIRKTD